MFENKMIVYGYTKCSTVKKALAYLEQEKIEYQHMDNVKEPLTEKELESIYQKSGLEIKRFFNTSGVKYRELNLKDRLTVLTHKEKIKILSSDGMLVKRPIFIFGENVIVGFKEEELKKILDKYKK